ncbi:N-glycosylation protein-domain-containing protein [Trametes elegans]|nr:N-glycosylation protein-domain-containing protein [Trametes elegans]
MARAAADSARQQEPPPYGLQSSVLVPADDVSVPLPDPRAPPVTASRSPLPPVASGEGPRPRSHTISITPPRRRPTARTRTRAVLAMSAPSSSPPPYSLTPPDLPLPPGPNLHPHLHPPPHANPHPHTHAAQSQIGLGQRAASSPHLRSPVDSPVASHSRQVFAEHARERARVGPTSDDDDETESGAETDDGVLFGGRRRGLADTLRHRLLGKGKGRAYDEHWTKPITTAPGAVCAGETETEGEDSPRNLPTTRIRPSSLSRQLMLPSSSAWFVQFLFQLFRLLAIVPAVFGTLWNVYHIYRPPDGDDAWRVEYFVSSLWSVLTGWQCLQLTTGLLKRWKVYYSPFAALIRLLALQAICWPATQLTLTVLDHEARPLICWAAIGTTTCCSRSVQLWVTSNIVPAPGAPPEEALMRKGRRRRWDWAQVGVKCALPAGLVYCVMAWALVLRRELMGC